MRSDESQRQGAYYYFKGVCMKFLMQITILMGLMGLMVSTFAKERLVVLDPASIEIIYELGSGDEIVAIAHLQHSNIAPQEKTSKLPSVGSFSNPSVEKIISFKPTLVILSAYSLGLKERLELLGIKTMYLQAQRLDDLSKNINTLANLLHKQKAGAALNQRINDELSLIAKEPLNKSAIFLYSSNPLMGFNDNSVIADIFRVIGVKNLTPKSDIERPIISSEFILKANPDMIVLGIDAKDAQVLLKQNPALKNTKAAMNGYIFAYPHTYSLLRVGPNITKHIQSFKESLQTKIN